MSPDFGRGIRLLALTLLLGGAILGSGCAVEVDVAATPPEHSPAARIEIGTITGSEGQRAARALERKFSGLGEGPVLLLDGAVSYSLEDSSGEDLVRTTRPTGKTREVKARDPFVNREYTHLEHETTVEIRPVPYVHRRAEMRLDYSLGGRESGSVAASFEQKYGGVNENAPQGPKLEDLPPPEETAEKLADLLAEKLALRINYAAVQKTLSLDPGEGLTGEKEILEGVAAARAGRWEEAVSAWESVLAEAPGHAPALYNLGVYHERLGGKNNMIKALELYTKAARSGGRPDYREAVTRVTLVLKKLDQEE